MDQQSQATSQAETQTSPPAIQPIQRNLDGGNVELYESEEVAFCSCGNQINIVHNSSVSDRKDRRRFREPKDTQGWNVVRCNKCLAIADPQPKPKAS